MSTEQNITQAATDRGVWGESAADIWERRFEPQRAPLFDAVLEAINVRPGMTLLDAGCGGGSLTLAAYRAGACVSGCDISEGVLARARAKVPAGEFRVADLAALPYADKAFDIVVACDCLLSVCDAKPAMTELSRVSKPTGNLCLVIWEEPRKSDFSRVMAAMQALLPTPPLITPLALSSEGVFDALMREVGLHIRTDRTVRLDYRFASFEDFWSVGRLLGSIKLINDAVGEEKVRNAAREAAQPSMRQKGALVMNNAYRLIVTDPKPV